MTGDVLVPLDGEVVLNRMMGETQGQEQSVKSASDQGGCVHQQLVRVEQSGINEVDTDVLLYTCAECGRSFTITDY
jgi:hypothetical protein